MTRSIRELRSELEQIQKVLEDGTLLRHAPEAKRSLSLGVEEMLDKSDLRAEENLLVGLLGGTGVGKSTLMNALAGHTIASASHRRPHTDQILVYRHGSTWLPDVVTNGSAAVREITHEVDRIAQIVLCDLPDFDSMVAAHRRGVLDFLTHLDLLVWVATPDKYADGGFYDFLAEAPKAGRNYVFVLNKADRLFEAVPPSEGYDRLARVSGLFARHLEAHGVESPLIHCVSAAQWQEGAPAAPWNQFPLFRDLVFQRRELKEIAAIKSANLDVEVRRLLRSLEGELRQVRSLVDGLHEFLEEIDQGRSEWREAGRRTIGRWTRTFPFEQIAAEQGEGSRALSGPALLIGVLTQKLSGRSAKEWHDAMELGRSNPDGGLLAGLRRELDRLDNRMTHRLLQAGLPRVLIEEARSALALDERWQHIMTSLEQRTEGLLVTFCDAPRRGFRLLQRVTYGMVYGLFVVSLVRVELLSAMLQEPSWMGAASIVLDFVLSLFRATGLAALGSLVGLQFLLGYRFHRRHKKWLQQRTQRFIETLEQELVRAWEMELDEAASACRQFAARKEAALEAFRGLRVAGREA